MPSTYPGRWSPHVRARLERMLDEVGSRSDPPPLATFDFDETCIRGDISHAVLDDLDREQPGLVARYQAECAVDLYTAYVNLVGTLCGGRTFEEVRARTEAALNRGLADGRLAIVTEIRDLMDVMRSRGWEIRVVTASAAPIVQSVVERYGLSAEHVLGIRPEVGEEGRYGWGVLEPVTYREGKLTAIRAAVGRDPLFAIGDSMGDRWMLEAARYALLLDHGDPVLQALASSRGWMIEEPWR